MICTISGRAGRTKRQLHNMRNSFCWRDMGEAEEQSPSQHGLCDDCWLTVHVQQSVSPIPTSALHLIDLLSLFQFSCLPLSSRNLPRCLSFHIFKRGNLSFTQLLLLVTWVLGKIPKMPVALQLLRATQLTWKCQSPGSQALNYRGFKSQHKCLLNLSCSTV